MPCHRVPFRPKDGSQKTADPNPAMTASRIASAMLRVPSRAKHMGAMHLDRAGIDAEVIGNQLG
jgi:hypothetical protein